MQETMTETQVAAPVVFKPAPPRGVLKTGIPTDGYWIFAGLAKAGKTTLAGSIPGAYIIETEKGADRISGWIQDIANLNEFRQAFAHGLKDPAAKVIVIDTLDSVLGWMADECRVDEKGEGINSFQNWKNFANLVDRMTNKIKNCGKLVIFLAHFKEPKLDNEGKLVITQSINAPSSKVSSHMCSQADVIAVCSKKRVGVQTQYQVRFHGDGILGAYGSRLPELENKEVMLPNTNQWAAILSLFENKKEEAKQETKKAGGKK